MTRRKYGSANVEEHPKGSGLFRVRARIDGKLVTVASKLSEKAANETANAYADLRSAGELRHGITVDQFGGGFLDRREKAGVRGIRQERSKWAAAIERDPIGRIAIASLRRSDIVEWRDRMLAKRARQTVKNAVNLLRAALAEALDRELVTENVARDIQVPKRRGSALEDLDGVLNPNEQLALMAAVPDEHKPMVAVALLTGLRWSELSWLKVDDIQGNEILVRRSVGGGPTKSGKPRRVPLMGPARVALEAQIGSLSKGPWVFPSADGTPRNDRPRAWKKWVAAAGISRRVRWHDLRHTCATSLLAGWWSEDGHRWSLDEVCKMMGHSSINVTERYARKLDETLDRAVQKTKFPGGNGSGGSEPKNRVGKRLPKPQVADSNSAGSAQQNSQIANLEGMLLGTSRELPIAIRKALRITSPRSDAGVLLRGISRAWPGLLAGDRKRTPEHLKRAERAMARMAGGGR